MKRLTICLAALAALAGCSGTDAEPPPLDGAAHYFVSIASASVKATNNGSYWDDVVGYEAPDVYCEFSDGTTTVDTAIVQDSYAPTWTSANAMETTVGVLRGGTFTGQLWDADAIVDDQITNLGALTFTDDQIRSGTYVINNWDGTTSITFHVTPAP